MRGAGANAIRPCAKTPRGRGKLRMKHTITTQSGLSPGCGVFRAIFEIALDEQQVNV